VRYLASSALNPSGTIKPHISSAAIHFACVSAYAAGRDWRVESGIHKRCAKTGDTPEHLTGKTN
jgi:hypothetical protein